MKPAGWRSVRQVEHASLTSLLTGTHQHLPARHEVGALADALEDALQLRTDEAAVWGDRETRAAVREEARRGLCRNI